jgi:Macrocin-O-methyltransferase (TylF)
VALDAWGVDSFEGLPDAVADDEGAWVPGDFFCPRSVTEWNLRRQGVDLNEVELVEGWFDDVLTPELGERVGGVDIAMLDADAYSSTVPVLTFLGPLLADRAWLIFDDWFSGGNLDPVTQTGRGTGVERAFDEWLATQPCGWEVEQSATYSLSRNGQAAQKAGMVLRLTRSGSG